MKRWIFGLTITLAALAAGCGAYAWAGIVGAKAYRAADGQVVVTASVGCEHNTPNVTCEDEGPVCVSTTYTRKGEVLLVSQVCDVTVPPDREADPVEVEIKSGDVVDNSNRDVQIEVAIAGHGADFVLDAP